MPNRKKYYAIFEDFVKGDIVLDKTETYEQAEQVIENHKTKSRMLIGLNPLGSLSYSNKYRIDEIDWEKLNKIDKKADEEWYEDVGYGDPRVDNEEES